VAAPDGPADIDWSAPWLEPYRDLGQRVAARWSAGASVAQALDAERPVPVPRSGPPPREALPRFVPHAELPPGVAYEAHIDAVGTVPTRDGLHDFFNGLVWLRFPALKRALNAAQAAELRARGTGPVRGALRDALTLLDENGAAWSAPPTLAEALARRDWPGLLHAQRARWQSAPPLLVGHALLHKLCAPRKPITAHVWPLPPGLGPDALADALATRVAEAAPPLPRPLPLPVLGVPGWWPPNEDPGFIDDSAVFRPRPGPEDARR
jgi:hypothetical protein